MSHSFVSATSKDTSEIYDFTTYPPRGSSHLYSTTRIWEAARATSAASSFFDHIQIGAHGESFVDGATGANNPIRQLWQQATFVSGDESLEGNIKCLVSIGTGMPDMKSFGRNLAEIGRTVFRIATETQATAEGFHREHSALANGKRYFRFNVLRGLRGVGLESAAEQPRIVAATNNYLESEATFRDIKDCAAVLSSRQCMLILA